MGKIPAGAGILVRRCGYGADIYDAGMIEIFLWSMILFFLLVAMLYFWREWARKKGRHK
jgi:hypothetical protein